MKRPLNLEEKEALSSGGCAVDPIQETRVGRESGNQMTRCHVINGFFFNSRRAVRVGERRHHHYFFIFSFKKEFC